MKINIGICLFLVVSLSYAQTVPAILDYTPVFGTDGPNGFSNPTWFGEMPGQPDHYLVLEKSGNIILLQQDGASYAKSTFYQISVSGENHQGLLSMAFHPQFATNRMYFICYTDQSGASIVERRTATTDFSQDSGDQGEVVISLAQPDPRHNFGQIAFGPDGYLYIGSGNGGISDASNTNGQDVNNLFCAILRIDVDSPAGGANYGVPSGNPFAAGGGSPEIYAYGLRNPWRFSFDPLTQDLYVGDVGSNITEEISLVAVGDNMGWKVAEGTTCYSPGCNPDGTKEPLWEYLRQGVSSDAQEAKAIVGGYVYRANESSPFYGVYFFGDNRTGGLWGLINYNGQVVDEAKFGIGPTISTFGTDTEGNIYMLEYANNGGGVIYKLELGDPSPVNPHTVAWSGAPVFKSSQSQDVLQLSFKTPGEFKFQIRTLSGELIFSGKNFEPGVQKISTDNWLSGIYFIQVYEHETHSSHRLQEVVWID